MSETHDNLLMAEYDGRRGEAAFAALVRRHINLVFSTALRQVGDAGAAEEIAQNVFVALAQASGKLKSHPTVAGWLYRTTLYKSREWLRSELRRRHREQVALELRSAAAGGDSVWSPLVPLLDEAFLKLREPDRLAVIMHFMEGRTFEEVGTALGVSKDTARKRVDRCLQQLTHFFHRRGFAVPALSATAPLFALASPPAPAGLAAAATAAAHSAASISTLTLLKGTLKTMAWTKTKTAVAVAAIALLTGAGVAGYKIAHHSRTSQVAATWDIQPDGFVHVSGKFELINTSRITIPVDPTSMESGLDIEQLTDEAGRPIKFTKKPGDNGNAFKYIYTLNHPVPPGRALVMVLQGTIDGTNAHTENNIPLIQSLGQPGTFQFHDHDEMGDTSGIQRHDVFRLPPDAVLLQKQPADLTVTTNAGGQVEVHFDKMLPPPNILDVTLQYRLAQ